MHWSIIFCLTVERRKVHNQSYSIIMYPVVKICNPKIGMWEGFCSVLQPPPGMRREIRAPICALRKTSFADCGHRPGMAVH